MLLTLLANLALVDTGVVPPTPAPTPAARVLSGGYGAPGQYDRRSRKEIRKARKRFGITEEEEEIIEKVVAVQVEQLGKDEEVRKLELAAQLEEEGIQARARHYKMQAFLYRQQIDDELRLRLKRLQDDEEETIIRIVLLALDD